MQIELYHTTYRGPCNTLVNVTAYNKDTVTISYINRPYMQNSTMSMADFIRDFYKI